MALRKYISLLVLLMLLATQGALAQHLSVHAAEGVAHSQGGDDDNHPDAGDLCDLCLLAKNMAQATGPSPVFIPAPLTTEISFFALQGGVIADPPALSYAARAPPAAA